MRSDAGMAWLFNNAISCPRSARCRNKACLCPSFVVYLSHNNLIGPSKNNLPGIVYTAPMGRLIETNRAQATATPDVEFYVPAIFNDDDIGRMCSHVMLRSSLNAGQRARITLKDPHFTILHEGIIKYFDQGQAAAPVQCKLVLKWQDSSRNLRTNELWLAITYMDGTNINEPDCFLVFEAMDNPTYVLQCGDAGGYCYEGNISQVIRDVVEKYGRGYVSADVRVETKDDKYNKWWQYRMPPLSFISSLLAWSPPLGHDSRWIIYPDNMQLVVTDQHSMDSLHRSTYYWGGHNEIKGHGDILSWRVIYDGSIYGTNAACVTHGLSAVSGAYYDRITDKEKREIVFAFDDILPNKFFPKVRSEAAFKKGPTDDPLTVGSLIGWTSVPSVPELSAGDLGIRYRDYLKGWAESIWLKANETMTILELKLYGHHIWMEAEGLGVDTIDIVMKTAKKDSLGRRPPYFLQGNWMVAGYQHEMTRGEWYTTLYCFRLQHDADGTERGRYSSHWKP